MARPTKEGLDYFPLDTDIDQDEKIIVVVAKYGMRGFGVIIRFMMEVYKSGYFYRWTEKEHYVFSMKVAEPVEFLNELVEECLKWGFFNQKMFEEYGILTSKGFQKRFLLASTRRKGHSIKPEYNLVNVDINHSSEVVNVNNNSVNGGDNVDNNSVCSGVNVDNNATKESKVKESKRNRDIGIYEEIISFLNDKTGKRFSSKSVANKKLINGRMSEGRTLDDFIHVIEVKCSQWLDDSKMNEYLRPSTLFAQKNFENYVNEKPKSEKKKSIDPRDKDIEFQRWIADGNDPDEFTWN
ncbi:conserved phage C-terminal domain-containing protein [Peribacillus sp. NPDC056705]|uniref:conserved phage C-terminal domain-containing protein n=1 Tax=Peribacillus sp. NPDC056705 TaxID=3345918 RepID=UPI00374A5354